MQSPSSVRNIDDLCGGGDVACYCQCYCSNFVYVDDVGCFSVSSYSTQRLWLTLLDTTRRLARDHGLLGELYAGPISNRPVSYTHLTLPTNREV